MQDNHSKQHKNCSPTVYRIHDLKSVHRNLATLIQLLKTDYVFEPEEKIAVIQQLEKSMEIMKKEVLALEAEKS